MHTEEATRVAVDEKSGRRELVTSERYRARYRDEAGVEHARHSLKTQRLSGSW